MNHSRLTLSQHVYDALLKSLNRNAKALSDPSLADVAERIQRGARTESFGVVVESKYIDLAHAEISRIVKLNGHKYASGGDRLLLLDIDEARALFTDTSADATYAASSHNSSSMNYDLDDKQKLYVDVSRLPDIE